MTLKTSASVVSVESRSRGQKQKAEDDYDDFELDFDEQLYASMSESYLPKTPHGLAPVRRKGSSPSIYGTSSPKNTAKQSGGGRRHQGLSNLTSPHRGSLPVLTNVAPRDALPKSMQKAKTMGRSHTAPGGLSAPFGAGARFCHNALTISLPTDSSQSPTATPRSTGCSSSGAASRPGSIIQWNPGTADILKFKSESTHFASEFDLPSGQLLYSPKNPSRMGRTSPHMGKLASPDPTERPGLGSPSRGEPGSPQRGDIGSPVRGDLGSPRRRDLGSPSRLKKAVGGEFGFGIMLGQRGELTNPRSDVITQRLLSLPELTCKSASGDIFVIGLDSVQQKLHRRRLGKEGLKVLHGFEEATSKEPWDHTVWREELDPYRNVVSSRLGKDPCTPLESTKSPSPSAPPVRRFTETEGPRSKREISADLDLEDPDSEVLQHFTQTLERVEAHRLGIQSMSNKDRLKLAADEKRKVYMEKQQTAVQFIINFVLPKKLIEMTMPRGRSGQAAQETKVDPETPASHTKTKWGKGITASKKMDAGLGQRMPFLKQWKEASKDKNDGKQSVWDSLLQKGGDVYVKGGGTQGKTLYTLKCQELGVVPSTQVMQNLSHAHANMSRCNLGRSGAMALRHALTCNTVITALDLRCNAIDSQAIGEIIGGLASGAQIHRRGKERVNLENCWNSLSWMQAKPDSDGLVSQSVRNLLQKSDGKSGTPFMLKTSQIPEQSIDESASTGTTPRVGGFSFASKSLKGVTSFVLKSNTTVEIAAADASTTSITPVDGESAVGAMSLEEETKQNLESQVSKPLLGVGSYHAAMSSLFSRVTMLDLSENPLGLNGAKAIARLLDPSFTAIQFLTVLKLNKCGIPDLGGVAIGNALAHGNKALISLHMANNSLGNKAAGTLGDVLRLENCVMQELDLGWNSIKTEGACALFSGLESNSSLTSVNLEWNGVENEGGKYVGRMLTTNVTLLSLNLTNTRLGSDAALLISEGLKVNKSIKDLNLNGNALGDDGARYLMGALCNNSSLEFMGMQGANMSSASRSGDSANAGFNPLSPDGSYELNLASDCDRVVAQQMCALDAKEKAHLMQNILLDGKTVSTCKSMGWPAKLPAQGRIRFDFFGGQVQKAMQVIEQKKFLALGEQLDSRSMGDKERLSLLEVMAPFNYFYCHQVAQVLGTFSVGDELVNAAAMLFTRAVDLEENLDLIVEAVTERDMICVEQMLGCYCHFRFTNYTGHYVLNLSIPAHRHIACRLKDAAKSEAPNSNNWINLEHDIYPTPTVALLGYGPPNDWSGIIPTTGILTVDCVSSASPPSDSLPLEDAEFLDFLQNAVGCVMDPVGGGPVAEVALARQDCMIASLRQEIGGHIFFTVAQVIQLVMAFSASPHRVEVVVCLHALMVDRNLNLWRVIYTLRPLEQAVVMWRLGTLNVFDKSHCSGHYVLDTTNSTHELVAKRLLDLAISYQEHPNIWNLRAGGSKRSILENKNIWGGLTSDNATPFLEFDFIGADVWELLGKTKAELEPMSKGDRLDAVTKLGKRMELNRIKDMYAYYDDGSSWQRPEWQSIKQLFSIMLNKTPQAAAYDRLVRKLVRIEARTSDMQGDSYLEDIFDEMCGDNDKLAGSALEATLRAYGYTRSEIHFHYHALFDALTLPSARRRVPVILQSALVEDEMGLPPDMGMGTGSDSDAGGPGEAEEATLQPRGSEQPTASSPFAATGAEEGDQDAADGDDDDAPALSYRSTLPTAPSLRRAPSSHATSSVAGSRPCSRARCSATAGSLSKPGTPVGSAAGAAAWAPEPLAMVDATIDFVSFVAIIMTEPLPEFRNQEIPPARASRQGGGSRRNSVVGGSKIGPKPSRG